jgi:probable phosphoglycerate mutase
MYMYLIRHGQSYVNLESWEPDRREELDAGLTPLGREQAHRLARWILEHVPEPAALHASTMRRARETAEILTEPLGKEIRFDPRLREFGNNRLNQEPYPEEALPEKYADFPLPQFPFASVTPTEPDGESYWHFRGRVGLFAADLLAQHAGEAVLVVCHGGVINACFDNIFNTGPHRRCEILNLNTSITLFEHREAGGSEPWRLHYQGRADHLIGLRP